jgi:hypothetical protein
MTIYYALRGPAGLVLGNSGGFVVLDRAGRAREFGRWHCPRNVFCGDIAGWALSPDGQQLVLSTFEVGARSNYPGLHIVDLETGADRRIPPLRGHPVYVASLGTLERQAREQQRIFGCPTPSYLSWSPDGSRLAYTCLGRRVYTIRPDGTGRHLVPIPTADAFSPTWAPDGTRIAYSNAATPIHSSVYVVDLHGRHEQRIATGALPDWSPNGNTISYTAPGCGTAVPGNGRIRLVTPSGRDVTPSKGCAGIGPRDSRVAAWSPDGDRLAIVALSALYVVNADGTGLERVRRGNFLAFGPWPPSGAFLRPLWQPRPK